MELHELIAKIKPENLAKLLEDKRWELEKVLAWQDDYYSSHVTWEEFDAKYRWCTYCESWQEGFCICYAR